MRNAFFAVLALAFFVFFFPNYPTRLDESFPLFGIYEYNDFVGDIVLAIGASSVLFLAAAINDAFKR